MATWSSRRKSRYALAVIATLVIFVGIPTFLFFYEKPTCFDSKKNGGEFGIDCGGKCSRLCQSAFLPPRIEWGGAKIEKLSGSLYNVAAYIVNPNVFGAAVDVPYKMELYDDRGILITEKKGKVTLYPHRNSLAFETAINVNESIPTRATFEFTSAPEWFKSDDVLGSISVLEKKYQEDVSGSSLEVILENRGLKDYRNIEVSVVLYDGVGNVIGFSQTEIDSILAKGKEIAPYTWSINRNGQVISEEIILSSKPLPVAN